jgi:hypothetical protein
VVTGEERSVDAVDFLFSSAIVPRFVLRYFSADSDSLEKVLVRWSLWKVFEYEETDGTPGFDPSTENIVSHYRLFNRQFTTMSYHKETVDDVTVHYVCTSLDPVDKSTPYPNVDLCAHVAEKETTANRTRISPNSLKWSVNIANYPYTSNTSRLGVKVSFDSKDVVKDLADSDASLEDDQNEGAVDLTSSADASAPKGIASWTTSVSVTGQGCAASSTVVRSVVLEAQVTKDIDNFPATDPDAVKDFKLRVSYFSFPTDCPNPDSIIWDPELGVALEDDTESSGVALSVSSVLLLLALFALLL